MPQSSPSDLRVEHIAIAKLAPYPRNARTHSKRQIAQIAKSIERFGFINPVIVDANLMIMAGHGRVAAAKTLKLKTVPIVRLAHLSQDEIRAYILADNQLALNAGWDKDILAIELQHLVELNFEIELIGFETAEIDLLLDAAQAADPEGADPDDVIPPREEAAVTRLGDVWQLGRHKLICGDARDAGAYQALLGEEAADLLFTDPPYNVVIDGNVSGKGKIKHREFAEASGEMSRAEFEAFLVATLGQASSRLRNGALAFVCMDWRHMSEMLKAGEAVFDALKNLCVWTKTNGGMGSLYRSQHELVFVFKKGKAAHVNNVELGKHGRNRTNVWSHAGANSFGPERDGTLKAHPTAKPVALVEDAIKDASKRGALVLDAFAGSGATLIAAQRCGRGARLIEIDPGYCDVIVKRFSAFTGREAVLEGAGLGFAEIALERTASTTTPQAGGVR